MKQPKKISCDEFRAGVMAMVWMADPKAGVAMAWHRKGCAHCGEWIAKMSAEEVAKHGDPPESLNLAVELSAAVARVWSDQRGYTERGKDHLEGGLP